MNLSGYCPEFDMTCRIVSSDEMACFIKNENMIVVDTRPSTMFIKYHIENSMTYKEFLAYAADKKDLSKLRIVFVCSRGHRSLRLGSIFSRKTGLTTYFLERGLTEFMQGHRDLVVMGCDIR